LSLNAGFKANASRKKEDRKVAVKIDNFFEAIVQLSDFAFRGEQTDFGIKST
jgi:hypothetical protein